MTKLSSGLPKEYEDDGLGSINKELIAHPHETHVIIAIVNCKAVTLDVDKGFEVATARILQIEPMRDLAAAERARDLLLAAQERRTGRQPLPITVDGETGEMLGRHLSAEFMAGVTVIGGNK